MDREQALVSKKYTAWQLLKSFWQSNQRGYAYGFLISVLIMTIALVMLEVVLNYWYNYFYDALQDYHKKAVLDLLWIFAFLAAFIIILAVYRYYLQSYLALKWRRWLTDQFLNRWLEKRSYYYLENFDEHTDNPDQRIQEDIGALVNSSLSLLVGFISAVTTLFAFLYILWSLSGILHLSLGPLGQVNVPGYLAWVGIFYAAVGTYLTFKIGYPLVGLNFEQQRREANFRFAAVDLRKHTETVALYRGEHQQKNLLTRLFERVLSNWYLIILRQKLVLWFTAGYNQVAVLVPLLVALPNYFGRVFKLGGLMQTLRAFANVQEALSFFVNSYTQIAEWRAVMRRLLTFLDHMVDIEQQATTQNQFVLTFSAVPRLTVKNVNILTPRGEPLLKAINLDFKQGQSYVIKGDSGIGKSSFVRAIAGIWPFGGGEIQLPAPPKQVMYVPQKPYMPLGTLRDALLFPNTITASDKDLNALLSVVGLSPLVDRLNEVSAWSEQLSVGEQQRIAFLRVLLQRPDWVFLDESTSSLDKGNEEKMYGLLKTHLPNTAVISVGHRPSLDAYHDQVIDITNFRHE